MRIALFNWRDLGHPRAGGAEVLTHTLCAGMAARGHRVTLFCSGYPGAARRDDGGGYEIIRAGLELTCRWHAARWLRAHRGDLDVVVDEVNTLPFFSPRIVPERTLLLMFQLAREVWLAEGPFLVKYAAYAVEPWYLRIYRHTPVLTISQSSARSMRAVGMRGSIEVLDVAVAPPLPVPVAPVPGRIGYVGRLMRSKRVDHVVRAVALLRRSVAHAHLVIVGGGTSGETARLRALASSLGIADAVEFTGALSDRRRDEEMARFDVIAMASLREGWGLAITEAARYGVPSAVYPVPGLVDSTRDGETGIVAPSCTAAALAASLQRIVSDPRERERLGAGARAFAARFTPERLVAAFESALLRRAAAGS